MARIQRIVRLENESIRRDVMNEIKELRVRKRDKKIEVSVRSDTVTALALLSVLILAMEKEMDISAEKILDTVRDAIEIMKR
jgi:hypothetical protein